MNKKYKTKYDLLIKSILLLDRGLKKEKNHGKYFNIHHIKPKSLGGSDQESNLIKLTREEHYLAHKYLYLMYKDTNDIKARESMAKAFLLMRTRDMLTAEDYALAQRDAAIHQSKLMKGKSQSEEHIKRRSESRKGFVHSKKTKDKISKSNKGRKLSKQTLEKHITNRGKIVLQLDLEGNLIKEWRAKSIAARVLKLDNASIGSCCRNNNRTLGGFKWRYKN